MLLLPIREWMDFIANICVLLITIYTFYSTFILKKIKLLYISASFSHSYGNGISVTVENMSLSPLIIKQVSLIVDNQYILQIKDFDSPLVLGAFSAEKIESEKFSYLSPDLSPVLISLINDKHFIRRNSILKVETSRKTLYLRLDKKIHIHRVNKKTNLNAVTKIINSYNGKIIPQMAKYALTIIRGDKQDTCFIFESGVLTGEIMGRNSLPPEELKSENTLLEYLDTWLGPKDIKYYVDRVNKTPYN